MIVHVVVSDPQVRAAVARAAALAQILAEWLPSLPEESAIPSGCEVLLHDLLPQPEEQVNRLLLLCRCGVRAVVLVLPVAADVLRVAVLQAHRLPLAAVEPLTADLTAARLATRLRAALTCALPSLPVRRRIDGWPLPPGLRRLLKALPDAGRPVPCVGTLARLAGVRYESLRREAHRVGMGTPGALVEVLRLACAAALLHEGRPVDEAARAHGFRDADHLRCRFRARFGITPSQARALGADELLARVEARWFPGACGGGS